MKKIKYSQKFLNVHKSTGLMYFIIGLIILVLHNLYGDFKGINLLAVGAGIMVAGLARLGFYLIYRNSAYITIKEDGEMTKKNNVFSKSTVNLNEVEMISDIADEYKLQLKDKEIILQKQNIDPKSLDGFKREIEKYSTKYS